MLARYTTRFIEIFGGQAGKKENLSEELALQNTSFHVEKSFATCKQLVFKEIEVLRPGQKAYNRLLFFADNESQYDAWKHVKSYFSSLQGGLEDALEMAVKRVNETLTQDDELTSKLQGNVVVAAIDEKKFALASGGNASAYLMVNEKIVDVSPTSTPVRRTKPLAAFVAGEHNGGKIFLALSKFQKSEINLLSRDDLFSNEQSFLSKLPPFVFINPIEKQIFGKNLILVFENLLSIDFYNEALKRLKKIIISTATILRHPGDSSRKLATLIIATPQMFLELLKNSIYRKRLYISFVIVVMILLLRGALVSVGARNVEQIISETVRREAVIEQLISDGKEKEALVMIDETLASITLAPEHLTDMQRATIDNLNLQLARHAAEINKLSFILSPTPIVSLGRSFEQSQKFDLQGLALSRGKLYTVNKAEGIIYELDGNERRIVVIKDFPEEAGRPISIVSASPGTVMVVTEDPLGVMELNPDTRKFTYFHLAAPNENMLPIAYATYNGRFYLLDARTRAIYRYELTADGYTLWSPWTDEDSIDLSQATTFAIDGSIYVTFNDHNIVRLVQGQRTAFVLSKINPPLEEISFIATREESPYLYLLDPPQRRVVVISKDEGKVQAQYTSPVFTDLRGVFADELAEKIYVLNGDTVYVVSPEDETIVD